MNNCLKTLFLRQNSVFVVNCRRSLYGFSGDESQTPPSATTSSSAPVLPSDVRVVIFGNDMTALSIAYHLSIDQNIGNNCVVITGNKSDIRSAESQKSSPINSDELINSCPLSHLNVFNPRVAQLIHYSKELFDVNTCGALYLARNQTTIDSFRRRISSAKLVFNSKTTDKPLEFLTPKDISHRYPNFLAMDQIIGGVFVPKDGLIEDMIKQRIRLQELCEKNGIKFFDNYLLNKININNNYISNVELFDCKTNTTKRIECQHFVNGSNNYLTRLIAKRSPTRVRIPTLSVQNQTLISQPFDRRQTGISSGDVLPVIHDFDKRFTVYQSSDQRLCLSGYEKVSKILQKSINSQKKPKIVTKGTLFSTDFPQIDRTGAMN